MPSATVSPGVYSGGMADLFQELVPRGSAHEVVEYVRAWLEPGSRVLELGCGYGRVLAELVEHGYVCTGVEGSTELAQVAQDSLLGRARIICGDVLTASLEGPFDAVLVVGATLTLLDPAAQMELLRRAGDLLRVGGLLVIDGHDPAWVAGRHRDGVMGITYGSDEAKVVATSTLRDNVWHTRYARAVEPELDVAAETHYLLAPAELTRAAAGHGLEHGPGASQRLRDAGYLVMFHRVADPSASFDAGGGE